MRTFIQLFMWGNVIGGTARFLLLVFDDYPRVCAPTTRVMEGAKIIVSGLVVAWAASVLR